MNDLGRAKPHTRDEVRQQLVDIINDACHRTNVPAYAEVAETAAKALRFLLKLEVKKGKDQFLDLEERFRTLCEVLATPQASGPDQIPNTEAANLLLRELEIAVITVNYRPWAPTKLIAYSTGPSRISAVYISLLVSFATQLLVWAIYQTIGHFADWAIFMKEVGGWQLTACIVFATLGGMASVSSRMDPAALNRLQLSDVFWQVFAKLYLAAIFGAVAYAIARSGLISILGINSDPEGNPSHKFTLVVVVLAFLCGFSERFGQDFIGRTARLFGSVSNSQPKETTASR